MVSVMGLIPGDLLLGFFTLDLLSGFPRLLAGWDSFPDSSVPDGLS